MKLASNCTIVTRWARCGRLIFTLSVLFFSNTDSLFFVIGTDAVFTVQLNGSGRAEIGMTLPDFEGEELQLLIKYC